MSTAAAASEQILDFASCLRASEDEDDDGSGKVTSYYQTPASPLVPQAVETEEDDGETNELLEESKLCTFVGSGKVTKGKAKFQKEVNVSAYLEGLRRTVVVALSENP